MPDVITINGKRVSSGENALIDLQIAKLPTHTIIDLPIYVFRAKQDGPVLLLTSGMHGDELNGIETLRRMIWDKSIVPSSGTVIAIPVVNIYGFLNTSRQLRDGRDLNRHFPGTKQGSLASRIAFTIMNEVLPNIDCGVDFHTGKSWTNYPQIRCLINDPVNLELARAFSPHFIVNSSLRDGTFRKEAAKRGKRILVYEGGESLRFDEFAIGEGIRGILSLMRHLGMTDVEVPSREPKVLGKSTWMRAPHSGLFRSTVDAGERVNKNEVIGTITDPFGEIEYRVKSKVEGYVLGVNKMPVVSKGDALIHLGVESAPVAERDTAIGEFAC